MMIIGQDPYHDNGQAHGLCFSVPKGIQIPPSLVNIYKELESDIDGFKNPKHGYLGGWAEQGVLLLNATLTVRAHCANSHSNIGWQTFTDKIIQLISKEKRDVVFILWGSFAQNKGKSIDQVTENECT
jgi:uracil-DNA glycosylase